jgi:branched-chain amino acid aminotransferase
MNKHHEHFLLNGELISGNINSHSLLNRGFLYGDGFFESMRFEKNKILLLDDHLHRLHRSLVLMEMSGQGFPDKQEMISYAQQLIKANHHGDYARLRLTVFRDASGFYAPEGSKASWVLQSSALEGSYGWPEKGIHIGIYTRQSKARGPYSSIKSTSSLFYIMAALHAQKEKWDDALVLNTSGNIIEATSSNVFLVYNKTLITPPLSEGCVDGVFRKFILDLSDKKGIPFREQMVTETELNLATEIFLTNTIRGIRWVDRLGDKVFENKVAKEMFELILKEIY